MRVLCKGLAALGVIGLAIVARASPSVIQEAAITGQQHHAELTIRGAFQVPRYSVDSRERGRVVTIDVRDASLPSGGVETKGGTPLVRRVVGSTTAQGTRIEVQLTERCTYHARAEAGQIQVSFQSLEADVDREASEPSRASDGPLRVRDLHLERRDGRDRVVVHLSKPSTFRVVSREDGPARLEIRGARLANGLTRVVEGTEETMVHEVSVRREGGRALVEAERPEGMRGTAIREGRRIVWLFAPPNPDHASQTSTRPQSQTIARGRDWRKIKEAHSSEVAGFLSDVPMQMEGGRGPERYRGKRIDLDFKEADIHNVLRLLAEVGGVNVVASDAVKGTVTVRMKNVPWDRALDVILQANNLGMVRRGNLIRVAPATQLEKEREAAIARKKQQEQLAPLETRIVPVSYASASDLQPRARELLSDRGTVSVDDRTNVLIVRDIAKNLDHVEELVRTLDTQTPQVLIEARIVEATSQFDRDVGIQWGGDVTASTATGNPTGLVFPSDVTVSGGNFDQQTPTQGLSPFQQQPESPSNFAVNLPAITGTGQGGAIGLTLGSVGGNVNLNVRLSAAESSGTVRIVSSPRILTLDNHQAQIAQGTLIPFSQVSAQGVNTAFQEAELELEVLPHVTSDGSVSMHVHITRDEPDFTQTSPRGDPTILKREAETDLLVEDGHTAVIGGIYTRNTGHNVNQVPFFGDIPILGLLFERRQVRDDRNELLIFLTPRIVNRAEALPNAQQANQ